jgi:hypothetical protein
MSKKLMFVAAFLLLGVSVVRAEYRQIPMGPANALATADYGGVSIATVAFSSANVILWGPGSPLASVGGGRGSIAFVHVSSASASSTLTDFIQIRSTGTFSSTTSVSGAGVAGSGDYSTGEEVYRIYVGTAIGTGGGYQNQWVSNGATGFDYVFPKPIRLENGAMIKTNTINFGRITVGYTKDE